MKLHDLFCRTSGLDKFNGEIIRIDVFELRNEIRMLVSFNSKIQIDEAEISEIENEICSKYNLSKVVVEKFEDPVLNRVEKDENLLMGKKIEVASKQIPEILEEKARFCSEGQVFDLNFRKIRQDKFIVSFNLTDNVRSAAGCRCIVDQKLYKTLGEKLKDDIWVKVKGIIEHNEYLKEKLVTVESIEKITTPVKIDEAPIKRVELHAHTQMSGMDSVVKVKEIIKRAAEYGHRALAITDHGVVQAFPEAFQESKKYPDLKIIYGMECYLVDDSTHIITNPKNELVNLSQLNRDIVVFDLETTGFNSNRDRTYRNRCCEIKRWYYC